MDTTFSFVLINSLLLVINFCHLQFYIFRRLAIVEENTELTKTARLAQVFKDIFTAVTSCKGRRKLL